MVPSRAAWRSLLWSAPLTALWVLLTYRWPAIPSSGIPTTTHQLAGRHQGAALDDLDVPTLITLLSEIDEDSIPLLAAYLDGDSPAGVNTRQMMPQRPTAAARRARAK